MKPGRHLILFAVLILGPPLPAIAHEDGHAIPQDTKIEALLTSLLEGNPGAEVMVSHVALPPDTTLPRHWHPGEEFAYMIQGSLTLFVQDEDDMRLSAGDVAKVPYKRVHTVTTGDEGATLVVFRVHEKGEPERVLVDQ